MDQGLAKRYRSHLKDCGCSEAQAKQYLELVAAGRRDDQIIFLKQHRTKVLSELHKASRRIDCIDFCIHELERVEAAR